MTPLHQVVATAALPLYYSDELSLVGIMHTDTLQFMLFLCRDSFKGKGTFLSIYKQQ